MKTVNDIMTRDPIKVEEDMTIMNVISKLKDNRISQVPVVSGKRYVGMLGYREILRRKSISINARVGNMAVTSSTLSSSDSIESALRKLKQSGDNAIPVVEKDHLVGIFYFYPVLFQCFSKLRRIFAYLGSIFFPKLKHFLSSHTKGCNSVQMIIIHSFPDCVK